MTTEHECRGELVARERRGQLSDADGLALRAHLDSCATCRMARQLFADFDEVSVVEYRDAALIEKLSGTARRWSHRRGRPAAHGRHGQRRARSLSLAAAVVLIAAGTASGTAWLWRRPVRGPEIEPMAAVAETARVRVGARGHGRAVHEAGPPTDGPDVATETDRHTTTTATTSTTTSTSPSTSTKRRLALRDEESPAGLLLHRAGAARQKGDGDGAITLYRRLQHEFHGSPEAILSTVPLGGMLLERRLPRAALAQYDLYLSSSHGGLLIPEALYGRGRALAALGDRQEEERNWKRLLGDFPNSAYAPLAQRRLSELR